MRRRTFLKKITGCSLAVMAGGLALPDRAKCEVVKPFAEIICNNYLDEIIRKRIIEIKKHNPFLSLGDLHCHSYFSDGSYSVNSLMRRAASLGLDFLVITEHLTPQRYNYECCVESIIAQRNTYANWNYKDLNPPVIYPALEISTRDGHLIAVFPEEYFEPKHLREIKQYFKHFYYYEAPVEAVAKLIRKMNGVSIIAHPNIVRSHPFGISLDYAKKNLTELVDAIEDMSTGHGYQRDYSKETGLASIGSSDDHLNILMGTSVTQFDRSEEKNLIQAIRSKTTKAVQITDLLSSLFTPTNLFFSV